jgi:hypothetical protein
MQIFESASWPQLAQSDVILFFFIILLPPEVDFYHVILPVSKTHPDHR